MHRTGQTNMENLHYIMSTLYTRGWQKMMMMMMLWHYTLSGRQEGHPAHKNPVVVPESLSFMRALDHSGVLGKRAVKWHVVVVLNVGLLNKCAVSNQQMQSKQSVRQVQLNSSQLPLMQLCERTVSCCGLHEPFLSDLICDTCRPRLRWTLQQPSHTNTPRLIDTHDGSANVMHTMFPSIVKYI